MSAGDRKSLGEQVVWPSFLPDGKRFLYLSQRPNSTQAFAGEQPLTVVLNWTADGRR